MPKKRKTRKEKITHEQKRQRVHDSTSSIVSSTQTSTQQEPQSTSSSMTFSLPDIKQKSPEVIKAKHSQPVNISTNEYGYLSNDLTRTALLTGAIVFAELFIKLFIVH